MLQVSLTELRASLAKHLDRVLADRNELVITRRNRDAVVIMPLAELESLRATLHLFSTPANAEHLLGSIRELEAGNGAERTLVD
jgi:antitoxin YefM